MQCDTEGAMSSTRFPPPRQCVSHPRRNKSWASQHKKWLQRTTLLSAARPENQHKKQKQVRLVSVKAERPNHPRSHVRQGWWGSTTMTRTWLHLADSTYSGARPKKLAHSQPPYTSENVSLSNYVRYSDSIHTSKKHFYPKMCQTLRQNAQFPLKDLGAHWCVYLS